MDELKLLYGLRSGDKAAFEELVSIYSHKVLNTCFRFIPNQKDAEDISQEVFIEIYQSIKTFKGNAKLSSWIYRIAVTKCLDEIRRQKRKKRLVEAGRMLRLDEIGAWIGGGTMPDKKLNEKENENLVLKTLDKLPENQRIAFTLSKMDGYSNKEIAQIMDTTIIAVESLVSHAKKKITSELIKILQK